MSFLTPLYIAGVLAVSLPIIFHLIRRTPEKRQNFSSLMFLSASPPRLSRRSRLTNILLLIVRAAALAALAFAFARPVFFRKQDLNVNQSQGSRVAILVDTSASMRRGDLWDQAKGQVDKVLASLAPTDEVALFFFDRHVRTGVSFAQWNELDVGRRSALLRARLDETTPTWNATSLGEALAAAADQLAEASSTSRSAEKMRRQIVLVSDMQRGGHAEALQGHQWPENVLLDIRPVSLKQATNASLQLVKDSADNAPTAAATSADRLRVRVTSSFGSTTDQFSVSWANERGPLPSLEPQKVYVTPGRSQIVKVTWPPPDQHADRLVLSGDDFDFDNTLFIVPPRQDVVRVVYLGDDAPDDAKGLTYYFGGAAGVGNDTPQRRVEFVQRHINEPLTEPDLLDARAVVVTAALSPDRAATLRQYLEAGGEVLWVVKDLPTGNGLADLLRVDPSSTAVTEAPERDFALLTRLDTTHPLFVPFADPRFGDFSKVHFWKHRLVKLPESAAAHPIASFDGGDPFLLESMMGKGRLLIMTSGWQPDDSQLALSTKFVPLIAGLLQRRDTALAESQYVVGDTIALPTPPASTTAPAGAWAILTPDNRRIDLPAGATVVDGPDQPGIFRLQQAGHEPTPLAVNIAPDESRTEPLAAADLEQFGARVGSAAALTTQLPASRQRQLQLFELENRQKMWRWLLAGVLGLVIVETALAGRLTRRGLGSSSSRRSESPSNTLEQVAT